MPYLDVNNQKIYFEDSAGQGLPLVFMHGFLMDSSMFDAQIQALSSQYRCIRFDARGFGKTQWDKKSFNLYDTASDCLGLMDHLGIESAVLIGMSQGGYCALRVALTAPHRVKALVLMSTRSSVDDEETKQGYRGVQEIWMQQGPIEPLLEGMATGILGPNADPEIEKHWKAWLPKWKTIQGENIVCAMNNLLDRDEITHLLHKIECPALVTHGEADFGIPLQHGSELSRNLKNCKGFVTVAKAAHAPNLTHPDIINAKLVAFLAAHCS